MAPPWVGAELDLPCVAPREPHGPPRSSSLGGVTMNENGDVTGAEDDRAPDGRIHLESTVAIGPETSELAVFVDVSCFAGAEEVDESSSSGFAVFECRDKPVEEITGLYVPPARLRIRYMSAELCELPVLQREGGARRVGPKPSH